MYEDKGISSIPVAKNGVKQENCLIFLGGKSASLDVRPQIVCPPQPAALAAPRKS